MGERAEKTRLMGSNRISRSRETWLMRCTSSQRRLELDCHGVATPRSSTRNSNVYRVRDVFILHNRRESYFRCFLLLLLHASSAVLFFARLIIETDERGKSGSSCLSLSSAANVFYVTTTNRNKRGKKKKTSRDLYERWNRRFVGNDVREKAV